MRAITLIKIFSAILMVFLLQRLITPSVHKYLMDIRMSRSSTIVDVSVEVGSEALLLCPVRIEDFNSKYSVLWMKMDKEGRRILIANCSTVTTSDDRVSLSLNLLPAIKLYYSLLTIDNVREDDAGKYLCQNDDFKRTFMEVDVEVTMKKLEKGNN